MASISVVELGFEGHRTRLGRSLAAWGSIPPPPPHLFFSVTRHRKEGVERREAFDVFLCFSVWLSRFNRTPFPGWSSFRTDNSGGLFLLHQHIDTWDLSFVCVGIQSGWHQEADNIERELESHMRPKGQSFLIISCLERDGDVISRN